MRKVEWAKWSMPPPIQVSVQRWSSRPVKSSNINCLQYPQLQYPQSGSRKGRCAYQFYTPPHAPSQETLYTELPKRSSNFALGAAITTNDNYLARLSPDLAIKCRGKYNQHGYYQDCSCCHTQRGQGSHIVNEGKHEHG